MLLIIGLDGLNLPLVHTLLPPAVWPTLHGLMARGLSGPLRSVFPTHSAAAWASCMTGQTPARHGVLDFMVRQSDGRYRHARPDPATTLWRSLGQAGLRGGVYNFPITFPPDPIDGWQVSGMLTPDPQRMAAPPELAREVLAHFPDYRIDVEWKAYAGREGALLADLTRLVRQQTAAARFLLQREALDYAAVAVIATDRLQHALWRYLDPAHPAYTAQAAAHWQPGLHAFYRAVDDAVAQLVEVAGPDATVVIVSDHGFQPAMWQFHVNDWLAQQGWLRYASGPRRLERWIRRLDHPRLQQWRRRALGRWSRLVAAPGLAETLDWTGTLAYCPWSFQQGVRLNVRGRDPQGQLSPVEAERLLAEIAQALGALREPDSGQVVVRRVYRAGEVYEADSAERMPDLVLDLQPNFALGVYQQRLFEPTGFASADHALDGIITLVGPSIPPGSLSDARLIDVAPTVLSLCQASIPPGMSGAPLVGHGRTPHNAPATAPGVSQDSGQLSPNEEAQVLAQLRNLGYMA